MSDESSSAATFFENGMLLDGQKEKIDKTDSKDSNDLFYFIEFSNWSLMEYPESGEILVDGYIK